MKDFKSLEGVFVAATTMFKYLQCDRPEDLYPVVDFIKEETIKAIKDGHLYLEEAFGVILVTRSSIKIASDRYGFSGKTDLTKGCLEATMSVSVMFSEIESSFRPHVKES